MCAMEQYINSFTAIITIGFIYFEISKMNAEPHPSHDLSGDNVKISPHNHDVFD